MTKQCKQCKTTFEITATDLAFYDKVSPVFGGKKYQIPPPTLCPDCRQRRRIRWRNERSLYLRRCDKTGREIISVFAPDKSYIVYEQSEWWSDHWDAKEYGQDYKFTKPFFKQFDELLHRVPQLALSNLRAENSDYCNQTTAAKNSYLCVNSYEVQDCLYCRGAFQSRDCVDCLKVNDSELCYESILLKNCYMCFHCREGDGCRECVMCFDCRNCQNCIGCTGLRNKKNYLFNRAATPAEIASFVEKMRTFDGWKDAQQKSRRVYLEMPKRPALLDDCEECVGDAMSGCKKVSYGFDVSGGEASAYNFDSAAGFKEFVDSSFGGLKSELVYEMYASGIGIYHSAFINYCFENCRDVYYCHSCGKQTHDCFGCIGLRNAEYCILNKQYTKEVYERLVSQIIAKMIKDNEWGEFFPEAISPFTHEETLANEYFPIKSAKNAQPREVFELTRGDGMKYDSFAMHGLSGEVINQPFVCAESGRQYKLVKQEVEFYDRLKLPYPAYHPDIRHAHRMALRNPRHLWNRQCAKCGKDIQTTYTPERELARRSLGVGGEIVYCEKCYQETIN